MLSVIFSPSDTKKYAKIKYESTQYANEERTAHGVAVKLLLQRGDEIVLNPEHIPALTIAAEKWRAVNGN